MNTISDLFYYTDYETFRLILSNGTLRFKESTKSNDKLDTNMLYGELKDFFNEKYSADTDKNVQIQFLIDFFETRGYQNNSVPIIACFTAKPDSRLLRDAYTMNRKDRKSNRYNGVCIQFNKEQLCNAMQKECDEDDVFLLSNIIYEKEARKKYLNGSIEKFDKDVVEISQEDDQTQDIVPEQTFVYPSGKRGITIKLKKCIVYPMTSFIQNLQLVSPFFKHEFWKEEEETRAVFCKKQEHLKLLSDGAHFFDVHISEKCIEKIILGPEFTDEDMTNIKKQENTLHLDELIFEKSMGTGVITSES